MKNVRTFLAGALCSALIFALATPAGAALAAKTIKVYTGIDIYLDDAKFKPTDANGQPVEAIARESVTLLCDMLEGAQPRYVTLDYTLLEGESVGPCPTER